MGMYVLLSRLLPHVRGNVHAFAELEHQVSDCVRDRCPELTWMTGFGMPGYGSCLDIVEAPYGDAALRLAVLVRQRGISDVELHTVALRPAAPPSVPEGPRTLLPPLPLPRAASPVLL